MNFKKKKETTRTVFLTNMKLFFKLEITLYISNILDLDICYLINNDFFV
jgi:hypothetical protein